ncbi:MAG: hypothetical protein LIP03_14700 [Bacteroidales bacterium]|nr:hypothetical protein [Bacteroidales bacterium]
MPKKAKPMTKAQREREKREHDKRVFMYGQKNAEKPMYRNVFYHFDVTVSHCEYCGKPMNASEVNDFGTLCEQCYLKEYYG